MAEQQRTSEYKIQDFILNRRSLRAMSGEKLSDDELLPLFEAARWAPSSYNNQTTKYFYSKRDDSDWETWKSLLWEGNLVWCKDAAALVLVTSRHADQEKTFGTHAFDAGLSTQNLLLEASIRGLVAHPMIGFDPAKAREQFKIPENYTINIMIAIGKPGPIENLPEGRRDSERVPTGRVPLKDIIHHGGL